MYKKSNQFPHLILSFVLFLSGCATVYVEQNIEKSLPQDMLHYYNDSFEKLREDLWEIGAIVNKDEQRSNFKRADILFEKGALEIRTRIGCFSQIILATKYSLNGDFDIQIDCREMFLDGIQEMDQHMGFGLFREGIQDMIIIGISKPIRTGQKKWIYLKKSTKGWSYNPQGIDDFDGTLRFIRIGKKINAIYKKRDESNWTIIKTISFGTMNVKCGFYLSNFAVFQSDIKATSTFSVVFDNFRINAAEQIIESDI